MTLIKSYQVTKGPYIYEIGNAGGIILIAPDGTPTTKVLFSSNEGFSWNEIVISENPIYITSIISEASNMERRFLLYGASVQGEEGYVVGLDFADIH